GRADSQQNRSHARGAGQRVVGAEAQGGAVMTSLPVIQNPELCARCGGHCCKTFPGGSTPGDWGAPDSDQMRSRLREALATGNWVIDRAGYVRPTSRGAVDPAADRWGECVFLEKSGCRLSYELRPFGCRDFTPAEGFPHA